MNARRISQFHPHQSERFNRSRKRRAVLGVTAGLFAVAAWTFVFSRLSYLPALSIATVEVRGADPEIASGLIVAATRAIQGSYLGIFSKDNSLIYPRTAALAAVIAASPRIAGASAGRSGLNTLVVTVSEKVPNAVICGDLPDLDGAVESPDGCYIADRSGFIFMRASMASSSGAYPYDLYYVPDLPADPVGGYATSTAEFTAVSSFVAGVKAAGLSPEGVLMKESGEYELYLRNPSDATQPLIVYFNTAADIVKELSNLSAFWNGMSSATKSSGVNPGQLEYIDVRYGSNVFYR